jgi:hypothetical protein
MAKRTPLNLLNYQCTIKLVKSRVENWWIFPSAHEEGLSA